MDSAGDLARGPLLSDLCADLYKVKNEFGHSRDCVPVVSGGLFSRLGLRRGSSDGGLSDHWGHNLSFGP